MKKLIWAMIIALVMLCGATSLAEEVILPDPGYYFGRIYDGYMIEFDEYPKEQFDAYVKLLTEQYGMQITEEGGMGADEFVFMEKPGVLDTEVFVSCFESEYECGMEIIVDDGITLSVLDSYKTRSSSETGVVAWDDGRMIADPGDFLGYEIKVTDITDMTFYDYGGNYFMRDYEEIDAYDIWKYIDALENSPYFEISSTHEAKSASYKQIFFEYVGTNSELAASCEQGRRSSKRECDLYIQIHYRDRDRSTFRIVTFPEFTVNSEAYVEPQPVPDDPSPILKTCDVCDGDGKCRYCRGRGTEGITGGDCAVCDRGKCYACRGTGHK